MARQVISATFCHHLREPVKIGRFVVTCSSVISLHRRGIETYPDFGVYLDSSWKAIVAGHYPALIVHWPDMKAPKLESLIILVDLCLSKMLQGDVVDIGCVAAHGRTGTLLASLIARVEHLNGTTALREVRRRYCIHACETRDQRELVINYAKRWEQMKERTISQLVYDLLDREGILPGTEIAKRLGIIRGTACSARDRWKNTLGSTHWRPRIVEVKVPSAKKVAPAEVRKIMRSKPMKNQAKLKEMGLEKEVRYYYMKFGQNSHGKAVLGVATVCLLSVPACEGDTILRGIAFCSPRDQFNKRLGRNIALGRAIKALERGDASEPIPRRTPAWILENNRGMSFLSEFNPKLTDYERKLLEKAK